MGVSIYHAKTDTIADGTNGDLVRPSDWNSQHLVTLSLGAGEVIKYMMAGTNSQTVSSGTVSFANSNGISFGMDTNGVISATVKTDYQTAGAYLTTAAQSGHSHAMATTTTNGAVVVVGTSNSNGYTLGVPSYLTTAAQISHSHAFATTTTNGAVIVAGTNNTNGLTIGVPSYLTTAQPVGAYLTTAAQSGHSHGVTLNLTNINGTTAGNSDGIQLSLSAAGGGTVNQTGPNIAAGGVTVTNGTVVFSNANGVSFGIAGSTMTASAAGGGGGATLSRWVGPSGGFTSLSSMTATAQNGSIFLGYEQVPMYVSATKMGFILGHSVQTSFNVSQVGSLSLVLGIYGFSNDTQLTLLSSGSSLFTMAWSSSTTTGVVGMRELYVPMNVNMTPGNYVIARNMSYTGNNTSAATAHTISHFGAPFQPYIGGAEGYGVATNSTEGVYAPFQGVYSTTSAGLPSSIGLSQVTQYSTAAALGNFYREWNA